MGTNYNLVLWNSGREFVVSHNCVVATVDHLHIVTKSHHRMVLYAKSLTAFIRRKGGESGKMHVVY